MKSFNETEFQKSLIALSSADFEKKIYERFPSFFKGGKNSISLGIDKNDPMFWGLEIGPGWYPLLWSLCEDLEVIVKPYNVKFSFTQVKEKYGGLRAYHESSLCENKVVFNLIEDIVDKYEEMSYHVCDATGRTYKYRIVSGSWHYACCFEAFVQKWGENSDMVKQTKEDLCNDIKLEYIYNAIKGRGKHTREFISTLAKNGILNEYLTEMEISKLVEYDFWLDYDKL